MNAYEAVDEFLAAQYRSRLEEVLCDGCFVGRLGLVLDGVAKIVPRLVNSTVERDGGLANTYEGILMLLGSWYRFRCQIFVDRGGQRFLSDVGEFAPVEWQARVALAAG